jgi:[FeFe] hydrogenase H-cluster maturation GTPase HydF
MLSQCWSRLFAKAPDVPRIHISLVGFMNAGKSSVMNSITRQPTSIVDATPGTTADTKISLMEIHQIGPCKLLDTAGLDEGGVLGQKKQVKAISAVKESDLVLYVIDPHNFRMAPFQEVFSLASRRGKTCAVVFNRFQSKANPEKLEQKHLAEISELLRYNPAAVSVSAINQQETYSKIIPFISSLKKTTQKVPLIPERFVGPNKTIFLNIPLDVESPSGRLLRPQTMCIEYALRRYTSITGYCMNLAQGRSSSPQSEYDRYMRQIKSNSPSLVITDSQAIDLCFKWTPKEVPLTTFSVTMANIQTGGKLSDFAKGITALSQLKKGDRVLICEACNHDRIGDDIGTVQLPTKLRKKYPDLEIDWAFGRSYEDKNLKDYSLALHCGGCMISEQQMTARIQDLLETGVPVVNYGLALSWLASPQALDRVLQPWL